jgi:hypothetical protein
VSLNDTEKKKKILHLVASKIEDTQCQGHSLILNPQKAYLILSRAFHLQHHIIISFVQWMLKKHPFTQVDLP